MKSEILKMKKRIGNILIELNLLFSFDGNCTNFEKTHEN